MVNYLTIKTWTNRQVVYVQPQYMYSGAQPGGVLMQTDASVVSQGHPATGQQPLYFLQQVTRYKWLCTDTNYMNPSLEKQSSRQSTLNSE